VFTPKPSSKQKRVKKTQELETGDAVTVQLSGKVTFFTQNPIFMVTQP
jgi:hypothetical protein